MTFAYPLPWWALATILTAAAGVAWYAYRRFDLTPARRAGLAALRFATLLTLVLFLMRPVAQSTEHEARHAFVPILVDTSRSMSIDDADGERRIDYAKRLLADHLLPGLEPRFQVEVLAFGETLAPAATADLHAASRRSDLSGGLAAVRERYRGRPVAGIVVISDGGDTGGATDQVSGGPAIFPVGVGSPTVGRDREVLGVTVAEAVLDDSRVDLAVSAVSHGHGAAPIELRLLENGRPVEIRRATPAADGAPVREVFHVSPARGVTALYTVEIPAAAGELVPENNTRSVLVQPPSRTRRVLLVEGAPGFEHSFLKRAWTADTGLEVDSVVRKGQNEQGRDTYYIQAARSRGDKLTSGYPERPEGLFSYDAIVLANVSADQLTRSQLQATRDFVGKRGGGLLVLGARSFLRHGLLDSALEEVLPLELDNRGDAVLPASGARGLNRVALTAAGEAHPVMQIAAAQEQSRKRWDSAPALASTAPLGGPRPGASVLAVTSGPGGAARALVAVQRYGNGRAMVFAGEAAWRWRMMRPSADTSYDLFWRQAIRWLALPASDVISLGLPSSASPGDTLSLNVVVRNAAFDPERDASVDVKVTSPDGRIETLRGGRASGEDGAGRFVARFKPDQPGVYRITAEARARNAAIGSAAASLLVGGADPEMTDPRLNAQLLQRLAFSSGGRVVDAHRTASLANTLSAAAPAAALSVRRDLWNTAWSFSAILVLLGAEWIIRRRWGLR